MKKLFVFLISLLVVIIPSQSLKAANAADDTLGIVLNFVPHVNPNSPVMRSPAFVPITASYNSITSSVVVNLLQTLGAVNVSILNATTGDYTEEILSGNAGTYTMFLSGDSGNYTIIFTLSNGTTYEGEFTIS